MRVALQTRGGGCASDRDGDSAALRLLTIHRFGPFLCVRGVFVVCLFDFLFSLVYKDGKVCISILHEAKADEFNTQEKMSEKWRPILGPEAVLVSVLSMLSDPNFESPANIDASVRGGDGRDAEGRVGDRCAPSRLLPSLAVLSHCLFCQLACGVCLCVIAGGGQERS